MAKKLRLAVMKPEDSEPTFVETTENSYNFLRKTVDGYIEALTVGRITNGNLVTVWLNEEGKFNGSEPNFGLAQGTQLYDMVMGTVVISETDDKGDTVSISPEGYAYFILRFKQVLTAQFGIIKCLMMNQ